MLKNISHYSIAFVFTSIISFLNLPILTRYLSVDDFGALAIFGLFGGVLTNFLSFGLLNASIVFFHKLNIRNFRILNFTNFIFQIISFALGFVIVILTSEFVVQYIFNSSVDKNLIIASYLYGCIFRLYHFFLSQVIQQKRSFLYLILTLINTSFLFLTTIIALVYFNLGLEGRILSLFIVIIPMFFLIIFTNLDYIYLKFSISNLKKSLKYSYPAIPSTLVDLANDSFDKSMLANFRGVGDLGYYQISRNIALISNQLMDTLNQAWSPFFFKNAKDESNESKIIIVDRYYSLLTTYSFICCVTTLFSYEIILLLTTPEFYFAANIIPLFVISFFLAKVFPMITKNQFMYSEKLIYLFYGSILAVISNIILNFILIPIYGVYGSLVALIISSIIYDIFCIYYSQKYFYLPISFRIIFLNLIIFLISVFFSYVFIYLSLGFVYNIMLKILFLFFVLFLIISFKLFPRNEIAKLENHLKNSKIKYLKSIRLNFL